MEKYTVRSFFKFKEHVGDLVDESYFDSIEECQDWCWNKYPDKLDIMYFEIHHSVGALTYYKAVIAIGVSSIHWKEIKYKQQDIPLIRPWWKITELPAKLR
jgi:molybdopterin synthase catalytic subunit